MKGFGDYPLIMIYGLERNRYPVLIEEEYISSLLLILCAKAMCSIANVNQPTSVVFA